MPTVTENVLAALPVESITNELQQKKAERLGRSTATLGTPISELSSGPPSVTDGDGKSLGSFESESYVHASQTGAAGSENKDAGSQGPMKSKGQLWNDLKINCNSLKVLYCEALRKLTCFSNNKIVHALIYPVSFDSFHANTTQSPRQTKLRLKCRLIGVTSVPRLIDTS